VTETMYEQSGIEELAMTLYFMATHPYDAVYVKPQTVWHNASNKTYWREQAIIFRRVLRASEQHGKVEA
jgi:hypothetical protein